MGQKLKIAGWIAAGAVAGALTTVSLQTVARGALAPLAAGRTAAARRRVRHGQERLRRAGRREEADLRRHLRHGRQPRPAFAVFRQEVLQGIPRRHVRPLRRRRHRDLAGRRPGQGGVADRRLARLPRRPQAQRPDHQDRRHRRQGPVAERRRQAHARRAQHQGDADHLPQGREPHLPGDHHARGNPHPVGARQGHGAGLRLDPPVAVPGAHGRRLRQEGRGDLQAGAQPQGPGARPAQRPGRPARRGRGHFGRLPARERHGGVHQRPAAREQVRLQGGARVLPAPRRRRPAARACRPR